LEQGHIAFPEGLDTLDFDSLMELVRWFERHAHEADAVAIWFDDGRSGVRYIATPGRSFKWGDVLHGAPDMVLNTVHIG